MLAGRQGLENTAIDRSPHTESRSWSRFLCILLLLSVYGQPNILWAAAEDSFYMINGCTASIPQQTQSNKGSLNVTSGEALSSGKVLHLREWRGVLKWQRSNYRMWGSWSNTFSWERLQKHANCYPFLEFWKYPGLGRCFEDCKLPGKWTCKYHVNSLPCKYEFQ